MKKLITLSGLVLGLTSFTTIAEDELIYSVTDSPFAHRMQIQAKYTSSNETPCQNVPFCPPNDIEKGDEPTIVPPASPENWYFFNPDSPQMIKYIASDNNGSLLIKSVALNADDLSADASLRQGRQDVSDFLRAHELEMNGQHSGEFKTVEDSLVDYVTTTTSDCTNGTGSETEDSVFDLLKTGPNGIHENKISQGIIPIADDVGIDLQHIDVEGTYPKGVGVKVRVILFNNQQARYFMPDGGIAHYSFDENGDPYLNLAKSRTPLISLSDIETPPEEVISDRIPLNEYFVRKDSSVKNSNYKFVGQTWSNFDDSCLVEELQSVMEAIGTSFENNISSGDWANRNSCRNRFYNSDYTITYDEFVTTSRMEDGKIIITGEWVTRTVTISAYEARCF